jgi:multiple sugar transport system substrate-binding protein
LRRAALLSCIGLSFATGCSAPSGDTVVRLWAMGREGELVAELLPEFERTHPGIRVEAQQLPWTAAHEKLLTAFAGDATPDVCQLGNTWIPEFAALKALEPLDVSVAQSSIIDPADYFAGIWDTNNVGGKLYGVPWYVDTRLLFYRRDLLAEAGFAAPPRSWPEWTRMLAAVKEHVGPDRYAILLPVNEFEPLVALALQQADPLLRDDGRWGNFRSEGFRRTLRFYVDVFRRGFAPPQTNADISNVWNEFGRGYFSFYVSGPWNIAEFKRRLPPDKQGTWMTAPLPGPDGPGASIAGGSSLVVFRSSRHKAAAWQLIEYLSQPAIQRRLHDLSGDLPPRRSAWTEGSLADDVYARAFRDQLERVKPAPKVPEWERIATEIRVVAEHLVHGELTVDQAAAELDARADRILEKRRSLLPGGGAG